MTLDKYLQLKSKYGNCSSWAIWNEENKKDTTIIEKEISSLNSKYVFVGLNISNEIRNSWGNFHEGRNDYKLMNVLNNSKFYGSFMTDLFYDLPIPKSTKLNHLVESKEFDISKHILYFKQKLTDLEINDNTTFILLGKDVDDYFPKFHSINKNKIVKIPHPAYRRYSFEVWKNSVTIILNQI